jgi:hypothetical protein
MAAQASASTCGVRFACQHVSDHIQRAAARHLLSEPPTDLSPAALLLLLLLMPPSPPLLLPLVGLPGVTGSLRCPWGSSATRRGQLLSPLQLKVLFQVFQLGCSVHPASVSVSSDPGGLRACVSVLCVCVCVCVCVCECVCMCMCVCVAMLLFPFRCGLFALRSLKTVHCSREFTCLA